MYGKALAVNPGDMSDLTYRWTPLPRKGRLTVPRSIDVPVVLCSGLDSLGRRSRSQRPAEALPKAGERLRPKAVSRAPSDPTHNHTFETQADGPRLPRMRLFSCYRCLNCGATSGCT